MAEGGIIARRANTGVTGMLDDENAPGILKNLARNLDSWKEQALNIAVIGSSGVGKSMLINTMRNIPNDHHDAAPVGIEEETLEPMSYNHPTNNQILLWDLPGIGTKTFPKQTYLERIDFHKYDLFLICSAGRFSENDIWLATECGKFNKQFYMLRTKIDIDLQNESQDHPKSFNEQDCLRKIRDKYMNDLQFHHQLFLISSRYPDRWEYPKFRDALLQDIPAAKHETLLFSMKADTRSMIRTKQECLQSRIDNVSWISAAGAVVPIPGLSYAIDIGLVIEEGNFYLKQMGLTMDLLAETANAAGVRLEILLQALNLKTPRSFTKSTIIAYMRNAAVGEIAEKTVQFFIPFLGSFIAGGMSYASTRYALRSLLNDVTEDAMKVLHYMCNLKKTEIN